MNAVLTPAQTRSVAVGPRQIHLHEFGAGPALLMLHGGGPGASGLSNYARNVQALAGRFRVLVPDLPGYGQSSKGVADDPFGDIATAMLGLLDALDIAQAHVIGNSLGGACALRMALDAPRARRPAGADGPGRHRHLAERADPGAEAPARLLRRRGPDAGQAAHLHPRRPGVRRQPHRRGIAARTLRSLHRPGRDGPAAAACTQGPGSLQAPGLPAAPAAGRAGPPDAGAVGHRGPRQSQQRRAGPAGPAAGLRRATCSAAPAIGCSGSAPTNSTP